MSDIKTASQISLVNNNASYAARRIFDDIERSVYNHEIDEQVKDKVIHALTQVIIDNTECRSFIQNILWKGSYDGYEIEANRILTKIINI